ncbi:MAG: inorganic phosphate transporter [Bacteroidia bacterium]|nr:inorganic phosphate transporter [Bacteroidia bacterium]
MDLSVSLLILLAICILCACAFEFINGFHDTANAVATVIYTHSLEPTKAVLLSGICNALGVLVGGISVAMGIINLLPIDILLDQQISHSLSMVFAMLLTAIIWNLGTWYLGIPASSSHTLIGSILGVGLGYSLYSGGSSSTVNWGKAGDIGLSLLISPFFGFSLTIFLMFLMKQFIKDKEIFKEPNKKKGPPNWIKYLLWFTCASVSFTHGSNDGQKGVGLIMLILIAIAPTYYALDMEKNHKDMFSQVAQIQNVAFALEHTKLSSTDSVQVSKISTETSQLNASLAAMGNDIHFNKQDRFRGRKNILIIEKASKKLLESEDLEISESQRKVLSGSVKKLLDYTNYTPLWVIILISLSLGIGTMVGWKRIVVTIGEKIGKTHLTYAQGASAELVAASTIGVSTMLGLPVSTTHVLSSGIAGSMVASSGIRNLQRKMVTNIGLAWVLTLPVCITLSASLFYLFRLIAG